MRSIKIYSLLCWKSNGSDKMHDEEILFWGSHMCWFVTSGVAQHRQSWPLMDEMLRVSLWWSHHTHCVGPSVKCALCKCSPRNVDTCNIRKGDADHICTEARLNTHCLRVLIWILSNKLFDHLPLKKNCRQTEAWIRKGNCIHTTEDNIIHIAILQ